VLTENDLQHIINEVINRIKNYKETVLVVIPRMHIDLSDGLIKLFKEKTDNLIFDFVIPETLPHDFMGWLKTYDIIIGKQFTTIDNLELENYSKLYVMDLHPALLKEVIEIRPYTLSGHVIINALTENLPIHIYSGFYWRNDINVSPFIKHLESDIHKLKLWGVHTPDFANEVLIIKDKLITASKLVGYENKSIMIEKDAILTSMAHDKVKKFNIKLIQ